MSEASAIQQFHNGFPRINKLLSDVKEHFPSIEEIASEERSEEAIAFSAKIRNLPDDCLDLFSATLRPSELILILHAMKIYHDERMLKKLTYVLKLRMKKKFFYLNWLMLQNDFRNKGLLHSMRITSNYMKKQHISEYGDTIFARLGKGKSTGTLESDGSFLGDINENVLGDINENFLGDISENLPDDINENFLGDIYDLLLEDGGNLRSFMRQYGILNGSALSLSLCSQYFSKCDTAGFKGNTAIFTDFIMCRCKENIPELVERYLMTLEVPQYNKAVIKSIIQLFGVAEVNPGAAPLLPALSGKAAGRIKQWLNVRELEAHFGSGSRKFLLWRRYYENVLNIRKDYENDILFFDIGSFVLVDPGVLEPYSYLYKKDSFNTEYEFYLLRKEQRAANIDTNRVEICGGEDDDIIKQEDNGNIEDIDEIPEAPRSGMIGDESLELDTELKFPEPVYGQKYSGYRETNEFSGPNKFPGPNEFSQTNEFTKTNENAEIQSDIWMEPEESAWTVKQEMSATAREVIINEAKPYIYKLIYENVGILYIKEVLANEKIIAKEWN